jgi:uncharacterized protein with HEPN domain
MSHREVIERFRDMLTSAERAVSWLGDLDIEALGADQQALDAIVMNIVKIGEAAVHLSAEVGDQYNSLPWSEMIGMRNMIVHAYFKISTSVVWKTVRNDIPEVIAALREILGETGPTT